MDSKEIKLNRHFFERDGRIFLADDPYYRPTGLS